NSISLQIASGPMIDFDINGCFEPIPQTTVKLTTSNEGWNNLATGFVNGISNPLSNDMIEKIANLFFKEFKLDDVWELFNSQTWMIVFISIGVAFSILTLIGAIATCIWSCTCRRSSKGVSSPCMNITGIILAFISFGFVVAGIVLYALSVTSFVNGVLQAPQPLQMILNNVNNFTTGAATQVSCSVENGFGTISTEVSNIPDEIINQFEISPTVSAVLGPNYETIGKIFQDSEPAVKKIITDLNYALDKITDDGPAKGQVMAARDSYTEFDQALQPDKLPQTLTKMETDVRAYQVGMEDLVRNNVQKPADDAAKSVKDMIDTVNNVVNSVTSTINTVAAQVKNVLDTITKFEDNLKQQSNVTGWITAGLMCLIIVPCVIALLAALAAFSSGSFLACKKKSIPSKGCCSTSCTLITLSIIVLAIAFIVMIPASFAMTVGYGTQLVCQPFFYDEKLQALTAVDDIVGSLQVQTMTPGQTVTLKFSEMMQSCEAKSSFMKAVQGDKIIDVNSITSAISPTDLTAQLKAAIDTAKIQPITVNFDALTNLGTIELVPDLSKAKEVDKDDINAIIAQMTDLKGKLQPTIETCTNAAESSKEFQNATNIKTLLKTTSTSFVNSLYADLTNTANQFTTDLIDKSAPCTPVYQAYEDVGMVGCEQMTGGVQGMWAAAGLAALFFVPTVIAVFCVASALRGGKDKQMPLLHADEYVDDFKLPPMTTSPVATHASAPHDSLPRLTVDTTALALASAPPTETFPGTAPIDSAHDPWESSYRHPDVYPYDQATSSHRPDFIDPLAYPAAAAAAPSAAYETAGPSAYPRINASTTNRYYDNQGYTPSTLTRF
ncbi:hypothetical protein PENTCL1PPCAC_4394, partial [Pristionchus entomophagus]